MVVRWQQFLDVDRLGRAYQVRPYPLGRFSLWLVAKDQSVAVCAYLGALHRKKLAREYRVPAAYVHAPHGNQAKIGWPWVSFFLRDVLVFEEVCASGMSHEVGAVHDSCSHTD